jgi:hypothetical protein
LLLGVGTANIFLLGRGLLVEVDVDVDVQVDEANRSWMRKGKVTTSRYGYTYE